MTSFRLRLALLVGGTTALLLLAGAYVSWRLTETFNVNRLDQELSHLARGNLERVEDRSHWARLDNALAVVSGFDRPPAYAIWVRNNGREEYRSTAWPAGINPAGLPASTTYEGGVTFTTPPPAPKRGGLSPANPGLPVKVPVFTTVTTPAGAWRIMVGGNPYSDVIIAANLVELNRDLQEFGRRLLAFLPVVLVFAAAIAWWLATRALRPVTTLTAAAEAITAAGLDRRIAAPAHDREFQRLVSVFNAMLDRLEQGFHQARRFSADASHELKTPLALLQLELEQALRDAPADSPAQQTYSSLLEEIQRLKAILDKLLLLSLADSGRMSLQRTPVDLGRILADILEDGAALAPQLHFHRTLEPKVTVSADAVLLEQALQNLVGNAIKYNRGNGEVRVTLAARNGVACVQVANTGPGIAPEDQGRVFERFFRGDRARTRDATTGVGLGLSLSREILRAHGGDLALTESKPDHTEFAATLPIEPPAAT